MNFIAVAALLSVAAPALAQEPTGCDKFKWPLDRQRVLLTGSGVRAVASGGDLADRGAAPVEIALAPLANANLPSPPERAPKLPSAFAGFVRVAGPEKPGAYNITLSAEAWIDVIQDGHFVKSSAFTGVLGCEGVRKSVRFNLAALPFIVQLNGVNANSIRLIVTPAGN